MKYWRYIRQLILLAMFALTFPVGAQEVELQPVPFTELPVPTQKMFIDRTADFIWIDHTLWSIEVKNRFEQIRRKFSSEDTLAPYRDPGAPMYYDPVQKLTADTAESALLMIPGLAVLRGQLTRVIPEGLLIRLPDEQGKYSTRSALALLVSVKREEIDPQAVRLLVRRVGSHPLKVGSRTMDIARYESAQNLIRPAEPAEVYDYFVRNRLDSFPFLVPRSTVMMSDGGPPLKYEWDNKPIRVNLPPMREILPKSPLRSLQDL